MVDNVERNEISFISKFFFLHMDIHRILFCAYETSEEKQFANMNLDNAPETFQLMFI